MQIKVMKFLLLIMLSMLSTYTISICLEKKQLKKDILFFSLSCFIYIFIHNLLWFTSISILVDHIAILVCMYYVYNKHKKEAFASSSIFYILNNTYNMVSIIVIRSFLDKIKPDSNNELLNYNLYVISYMLFLCIYIYNKENICKIFKSVNMRIENVKALILAGFTLDFILVFCDSIARSEQVIIKELNIMLIQFFFILVLLFLHEAYINSKVIFNLTEELEITNRELLKVKNNHTRSIKYINELYVAEMKNELKDKLKSIINGNENYSEKQCENECGSPSILSLMAKKISEEGIKINIDERCDLSLCCIDELELFRIINNILSNAARALQNQEEKIINIRIEQKDTDIIIEIENNGPKIDKESIGKIFKTGYTTKQNEDISHGYGLSIVKELIEKNQGSICVESTDRFTVFKISIPCKEIELI